MFSVMFLLFAEFFFFIFISALNFLQFFISDLDFLLQFFVSNSLFSLFASPCKLLIYSEIFVAFAGFFLHPIYLQELHLLFQLKMKLANLTRNPETLELGLRVVLPQKQQY